VTVGGKSLAQDGIVPLGPAFQFPTLNHELLRRGGETNFFTPTNPNRPWTSGAFGCVRNSDTRLHEGIDIKCLKRGADGESIDKVLSSRAGKVVHINRNISASNYGKYVVLLHEVEGLPIYTLYAHLQSVDETMGVGGRIAAGVTLGTLGRTTNTREGISRERAHLHFEIGVQINHKFSQWFDRWYKEGNNFHGEWNGLNLLGLDAAVILERADAGQFKMLEHLKNEESLCRVMVFHNDFDWMKRFRQLIADADVKNTETIKAWEVDLNFNGIPVRMVPVRDEIQSGGAEYRILQVDDNTLKEHPCSGLVFRKGQQWVFTSKGQRLMNLLLYR
tara:strand:+ start:1589 stop:2587 length:999 start_codon:yes stop_codon:yes gene_type:complete